MMKQNRSIFVGWQGVILTLAVVLYGLLEPAYCQGPASRPFAEWQLRTDTTVLLLQQSPPQGGKITPKVGVHQFDLNAEVTLTAIPEPGYYFVYWMGDVSDPTANSTIVYLDAPKIVIAVFERSEYELLLEEELQNTLGGGGRLYPSAADYSRQGGGGGGGKRPKKFKWPPRPQPEKPPGPEKEPDEFPVPEQPDEFPIPVPEPATVLLLGLGSLLGVIHRTKRRT